MATKKTTKAMTPAARQKAAADMKNKHQTWATAEQHRDLKILNANLATPRKPKESDLKANFAKQDKANKEYEMEKALEKRASGPKQRFAMSKDAKRAKTPAGRMRASALSSMKKK